MLFDLIRNGFSMHVVINLLVRVFTVFCVLPIHEFAHAYVAYKLGDDTARLKGRLTINPLAHLNIYGALMIFLCGFGYAQPVPINPRNFKNPKVGMAVSAAAGPLSNLLMALFFAFCSEASTFWMSRTGLTVAQVTTIFCYSAAYINVCLAIFNLIPIPPLDGSRVLNVVLPAKTYFKVMQYERYIVIGLFAVMILGILDRPFSFICMAVLKCVFILPKLVFNALI